MSDLSKDFVITDESKMLGGARGLIPRNFELNPVGCYGAAQPFDVNVPLIPWEEWPERIKEMEATKTRLSDIRNRGNFGQPIPSLDQNGQGYCWAYSVTACIQLARAVANQPYVPLSAHSAAWTIKGGKDEGGWAALALDFVALRGVIPQNRWPEKSMDGRKYGTSDNWDVAKIYRATEAWMDMSDPVYDRNLTFQQAGTALLSRFPCTGDYNHWGHSVCLMDVVDAFPNERANNPLRYGVRLLNSWRDSWGENGTGILTGKKAIPDGATCLRVAFGG